MRRLLIACTLFVFCARAAAAQSVSVRILSLRPPAELRLQSAVGGEVLIGTHRDAWRAGQPLRLTATAEGVRVEQGTSVQIARTVTVTSADIRVRDRRYVGSITSRSPDGRTLFLVDRMPLEEYVAGVVAAEALAGAPAEALRAQAVAARSYAAALAHLDRMHDRPVGPHANEGYDFCDSTHCQSFHGVADAPLIDVLRAASRLVLYSDGRVVAAWYSSTCGGHTCDGAEVGADVALHGVSDMRPCGRAWCADSPHHKWRVDVSAAALLSALNGDADLAPGRTLHAVRVLSREPDGRVRRVEVVGDRAVAMSGQTLWQAIGRSIGWGCVESAWFWVRRTPTGFHFDGRGLGHGAGMCQYGSVAMARAGWKMEAILAHYYPRTRLGVLRRFMETRN